MKAFVLAGGLGTRLRARFGDLPKALVPLGGRPFALRQLEWLKAQGICEVVLCAGFGAPELERALGNGEALGITLRYSVEPRPLGTAGALKHAARFVNGFLDLLSAAFISTSALKPLHVFGRVGLAFLLVGALFGAWFVAQWVSGEPLRVRPLMLFAAGLVLLGIQFILMGLLGEMIAHLGARADYPIRRRYPPQVES